MGGANPVRIGPTRDVASAGFGRRQEPIVTLSGLPRPIVTRSRPICLSQSLPARRFDPSVSDQQFTCLVNESDAAAPRGLWVNGETIDQARGGPSVPLLFAGVPAPTAEALTQNQAQR